MYGRFHVNFNFSHWVIPKKGILKIFFLYKNTCKNSLPYYGPTQSRKILTSLILYYVRFVVKS
jgi:hypothetical protein